MLPSSPLQKLTIVYSPWKKLLALLGLGLTFCWAWLGLHSGVFILETILVMLAIYTAWNVIDILNTRSITFYPDKITKTGYFGQTTIPTYALVANIYSQGRTTHFFHGSNKNFRESIKVMSWYISPDRRLRLETYQRNFFPTGSLTGMPLSANSTASVQFERALLSFRVMAMFTAFLLLVYVLYGSYLSWQYLIFNGYARNLPELPIRLVFVGIALIGYWVLRQLTPPLSADLGSYTVNVQRGQRSTSLSALIANGVAWLGLPLFLLFGNKLDFYLFLLIGASYCLDFYPRLSDWQRLVQTRTLSAQTINVSTPRRSLQVSLALLGGLSLASYAGNPNDFRIQQQNCPNDNGNTSPCHNGGTHGSSRYFGNTTSDRHSSIRRGGFGFFGGSHSSFGG